MLKLGRLLRLNKIIQFLKAQEDIKAAIRIFNMILFLVVYMHCFNCLWWIVINYGEEWVPYNYFPKKEYENKSIYERSFGFKYMLCLQNTVLTTLGSDVGPASLMQIAIASTGLFMGAIINANIFGELQVILSQMGQQYKEFQQKLAITNTAMINLKLN